MPRPIGYRTWTVWRSAPHTPLHIDGEFRTKRAAVAAAKTILKRGWGDYCEVRRAEYGPATVFEPVEKESRAPSGELLARDGARMSVGDLSPPFTPPELAALKSRGYARVNRHAASSAVGPKEDEAPAPGAAARAPLPCPKTTTRRRGRGWTRQSGGCRGLP